MGNIGIRIPNYHTRTPPVMCLQWQLKNQIEQKQKNIFKEGGMGVFKIIERWYRIFGAAVRRDHG